MLVPEVIEKQNGMSLVVENLNTYSTIFPSLSHVNLHNWDSGIEYTVHHVKVI